MNAEFYKSIVISMVKVIQQYLKNEIYVVLVLIYELIWIKTETKFQKHTREMEKK